MNNKIANNKISTEASSNKIVSLVSEARWMLFAVGAIYFAVALYGYNPADPGWSHTARGEITTNPAGALGAYLSDLFFYLFGLSAWWIVLFLLHRVWASYRKLKNSSIFSDRALGISAVGFVVLLLSSCALESIRLHSLKITLPLESGGMFGVLIGDGLSAFFGFTGATLLLLALFASGFSLFSGLSWLRLVDKTGEVLELSYQRIAWFFQTLYDRRLGAQASHEREVVVREEKKRVDEHAPIHIEMPVLEIEQSPRPEPAAKKATAKSAPAVAAAVATQPEAATTMPTHVNTAKVALLDESDEAELPDIALLDLPARQGEAVSTDTLEFTSRLIEHKLKEFGVEVKVVAAYPGPVVTRYEIEPSVGVKGSQVVNLIKDLARALSVVSIRVVETIPGKTYMALELPNPKRQVVYLSEILGSQVYADMSSPLTMAMGKDISGKPVVADLAKMPHVLVAGTTGSGKSVAINAMILSILYKSTPQQVRLLMVDPKMLELSIYEGIPHLLAPVITDMRQAAAGLNWCVQEMDKRYRLMASLGVRNIAGFNQKIRESTAAGEVLTNPFSLTPEHPEKLEELPFIVVFIDELADLMMVVGKKIEELIARLAQKARAAGIHLVLATQRPSVDVITGLIKANVPTRVAFQVSSKIDSRTILDQMGAENLLGQGDMLYLPPGTGYPQRVHGAFVSDQEVHRVTEQLKAQGQPQYIDGVLNSLEDGDEGGSTYSPAADGGNPENDPLYDQAVEVVLRTRRASISLVQRHLRIGYNRAARLIEQMETAGIVSPAQHNGNREVIAPNRNEDNA